MPVGRTHSISLLGMTGAVVEIEADISNQLPMFVLIGLPDAALNEAKESNPASHTDNSVHSVDRGGCEQIL
jgi:magnesium chelatase family protein